MKIKLVLQVAIQVVVKINVTCPQICRFLLMYDEIGLSCTTKT